MTTSVREYGSEGQRLLDENAFSLAEIARLMKRPKQRLSDWRAGRCRPSPEDRALLEKAIGVPSRSWDAPPTRREPVPVTAPASPVVPAPTAATPPYPAPVAVADLDGVDLPSLGLGALAQLAVRLRALEPTLPPRERVSALQAEARVLAVHEQLRQREADARAEYLASPAFLAEARALLAVVPGRAADLHAHLGRLGVALPPLPTPATVADEPPATAADIDDLTRELETAEKFRAAKESALALAHTLSLGLDTHADAIASIVLDDPTRAARLLALLDGADEQIVRGALERAMSVRDATALDPSARRVVVELLVRLGHADVARRIEGAA